MSFPYTTDSNINKDGQIFGITKNFSTLESELATDVAIDNTTAFSFSKSNISIKLFRYVTNDDETIFSENARTTQVTKEPYNFLVMGSGCNYGRNYESFTKNLVYEDSGTNITTDYYNSRFISNFNYKTLINCIFVIVALADYPRYLGHTFHISLKDLYDTYANSDYNKNIFEIGSITVDNNIYFVTGVYVLPYSVYSNGVSRGGCWDMGESYMPYEQIRLVTKCNRNISGVGYETTNFNSNQIMNGNGIISQFLVGIAPQPQNTRQAYVSECYADYYGRNLYVINENKCEKYTYNPQTFPTYTDQRYPNVTSTFLYIPKLNYYECINLACEKGLVVSTSNSTSDLTSFFNGSPSQNVYIPKIASNGGCNGDYYDSTQASDAPQSQWSDTNYYDNVTVSDDHNNYIDKIELNKPTLNQYEKFNTYYILTGKQLTQLQDYLWNADETIFAEIVKGLGLFGENPMNFILSLRQYPIKLDEIANADTAEITIGRNIKTGVNAKTVHNMNSVIDLGSCIFPKYFGDTFLSYSPYTNAKLYIPYCSEIDIPTADFVGHTINIKLAIDFITGVCRGIVFCDDVIYTYTDGNIGETISVTGDNASNVANNYIASVTNTLGSVASKNVTGTVSGVQNVLTAGATEVKTAGASTPNINLWLPQQCYFLVKMPQELLNDYTHYAHTTGFACDFYDDLINVQGYTVCADVDINFNKHVATDAEKTMLKNMLENGVYL